MNCKSYQNVHGTVVWTMSSFVFVFFKVRSEGACGTIPGQCLIATISNKNVSNVKKKKL